MIRSRLAPCALGLALLAAPLPAETAIRIIGATRMSESEVLTALGDRLEYVRNQPPTPARAADAAFMIEQIFARSGYNDVSISWRILGSDTIRLRIDEGPRLTLGEVEVEGAANPEEASRFAKLFSLPSSKRQSGLGERPPFRDQDAEEGLALVVQELNSRGFWDARAEIADRQADPDTGALSFTLRVLPGEQFPIATPSFTGEVSPQVRELGRAHVGEAATTARVNALRQEVANWYRSRGFTNAEVRMHYSLEAGRLRPEFEILEGKRYRLGKIGFDGLEKTDPARVNSRLQGLQGEYLDGELVDRRIRELIATGAFSSVRTETFPAGEDTLDILLRFEEAEARGMTFSVGFDSYEGPLLGATYYDRNFRGKIRNLSAGLEITGRSLLGELSLADPWMFGSDLSGNLRLFSLLQRPEGYSVWRSGLEGRLSYPVSERLELELAAGWDFVGTEPKGLRRIDLGIQDYQNPFLRFTPRLDHRDSKVLPTEGWHLELPLEIGAALGDEGVHYGKAGLGSSWHLPLGEDGGIGNLGLGLSAELLMPSSATAEMPIDLRLFNGGPRSVRSFPERYLGPRSPTGYPIGGEARWVANAEFVRPVAGALRGVVFFDAGGLSRHWEDFGLDDIELAVGLGLRINLPIGPVRFEYGHNLTRDYGEPGGTWHFAIGGAF